MWYRIFAANSIEPAPAQLLEHLHLEGWAVKGDFRGDVLGWTGCDLHFGEGTAIYLERYLASEDDIRDDLNTWAAWVEAQDFVPMQKRAGLMERIIQSKQLITLRKPIDHANESGMDDLCLEVSRHFATRTNGIYQVDSEGFFDAEGNLLLKEY